MCLQHSNRDDVLEVNSTKTKFVVLGKSAPMVCSVHCATLQVNASRLTVTLLEDAD
jgi:hypothetical protein